MKTELLLGMALLTFSLYRKPKHEVQGGLRSLIGVIGLGFSTIHLLHFSRSFLCIALLMYVLYLVDVHWRKVEVYHLITVFVILPFFQFFENSISIPLRLCLSDWAVATLQFLDPSCKGAGNIILFMNKSYMIDTGCAGLKMLKITLLFAGLYMFMFQNHYSIGLHKYKQAFVYLIFIALNLLGNLIRIISLVLFDIPEENIMHDILGCVCLILYVLFPAYLLLHYMIKKGRNREVVYPTISNSILGRFVVQPCCSILLVFFIFLKPQPIAHPQPVKLAGFKEAVLPDGIISYSNGQSLIYHKAVPSPFSLEHNPTVCWSTEGFLLKQINKEYLSGVEVYTGEFVKGMEHVYAAWWFSSGTRHTIDNIEWRYKMLVYQEPCVFINVNSLSKKQLPVMVDKVVKDLQIAKVAMRN